jgi:SAM-dependent methyltransferase
MCNLRWPSRTLAEAAPRGGVDLLFCSGCGHVFNGLFDSSKIDYIGEYENALHYSPRFRRFSDQLAARLIGTYQLRKSTIVEIGCGTGVFLATLCSLGNSEGYGFDPGYTAVPGASAPGDVTIIANEFSEQYADIDPAFVICRHVLEHVPDPVAFLQRIRKLLTLRRDVPVYFEVPSMNYSFQEAGIWDVIYEHFSYFTIDSLATIFSSAGFLVKRIEHCFGDQFIGIEAIARRKPGENCMPPAGDMRLLTTLAAQFGKLYSSKVRQWQEWLYALSKRGDKAVIWGVGSKGVTFLNIADGDGAIQYAVDLNPAKQGRYVAGTGQKIVAPNYLEHLRPEHVLITNPLYIGEIRQMLADRDIVAEVSCV